MKTVKKFGFILLVIIVLLIIVAFFLPSRVHVERSMFMKVPVEIAFEQINTLKNWETWSPWHNIDTAMKIVYSGPEAGNDASYRWESKNPDVGSGTLTITASIPYDTIVTVMDFGKQGLATGTYIFQNYNDSIKVTWAMDSRMGWNPVNRYFGLFMDKLIGKDFEKGLSTLKAVSEELAAHPPMKIEQSTQRVQPYMAIREICTMENIGQKMGEFFGEIMQYCGKAGINPTGPPFAIYYSWDDKHFDMEAGFPVDKTGPPKGRIRPGAFKESNVIIGYYYGPYEKSGTGHETLNKWIAQHNKKITGAPWEVYLSDPQEVKDPNQYLTQIIYPVE